MPPASPPERGAAGPSPVAVVLPYAALAALALLPLTLVRLAFHPITDPDSFWHIRAGEYLWQTWQFSGPDPWTTASTQPFVLHEWLPELGIAAAYHLGGFLALSWVQAALPWLLLLALGAAVRSFGASTGPVAVVTGAAWLGTTGGWALRPQLVTFLLLVLTVAAWLRTAGDLRPRWWLVPLTWAWAMSHGLWVAAPVTGAAVVVGLALDRRLTRAHAARLAAVPLLGVVVAALTPVGPELLLKPFTLQGYARYVQEWATPSVTRPAIGLTVALAVLVAVLWARRPATASWARIGVWGVGLGWSLEYTRTVPLGAITLAVLAGAVLADIVPRRSGGPTRRTESTVLVAGVGLAAALCLVLGSGWSRPAGLMSPALETRVAQLPAGSTVFNEYELGGYLLFADRDLDPVIDGRADVYSVAQLARYVAATQARPGWRQTVTASGATSAILPLDSPLGAALRSELGWTEAAHDGTYALLLAPGS